MQQEYDLELERVVKEINNKRAETVCIQLPDGLKPNAEKIAAMIEKETKANVLVWAGSCFGACDIPPIDKLGVDLLIQWGHLEWKSHS